MGEDVLVDVCLHGMMRELLDLFGEYIFSSFFRLMVVGGTNEFVIKNSMSSSLIRSKQKKRAMIATAKKNNGAKSSRSKSVLWQERGQRISNSTTFPLHSEEGRNSLE